jgi:hypothetical protein
MMPVLDAVTDLRMHPLNPVHQSPFTQDASGWVSVSV